MIIQNRNMFHVKDFISEITIRKKKSQFTSEFYVRNNDIKLMNACLLRYISVCVYIDFVIRHSDFLVLLTGFLQDNVIKRQEK